MEKDENTMEVCIYVWCDICLMEPASLEKQWQSQDGEFKLKSMHV